MNYLFNFNEFYLLTINKILISSLTAHMGPALALIVMTYAGCDAITAMIMLIVALTFNGAACQTNLQNHQDLAPNYAGSLYGIMNTFGSFPGFIIPPIIGALTNERVRINQIKNFYCFITIEKLVKEISEFNLVFRSY